jgi:hypothetical protein
MSSRAVEVTLICAFIVGCTGTVVAADNSSPQPSAGNDFPCHRVGSKRVCEYRLNDQIFFLNDDELVKMKSFSDHNQKLLQSTPNSPTK